MRRGFSQGALDNAILCYRETMALVTTGDAGYDPGVSRITEEAPRPMSGPIRSPPAGRRRTPMEGRRGAFNPSPPAPSPQEPFLGSFTPRGGGVFGRLSSFERADQVIRP